MIPDSSGSLRSAAWLTRQPKLHVSVGDDPAVHGCRPGGTCWAGPRRNRRRHLLLAIGPWDTLMAIPENDIVWIDVPPAQDPVSALLHAQASDPGQPGADAPLGAFEIGDHQMVQVALMRERHGCEPGPDPLGPLDVWSGLTPVSPFEPPTGSHSP